MALQKFTEEQKHREEVLKWFLKRQGIQPNGNLGNRGPFCIPKDG